MQVVKDPVKLSRQSWYSSWIRIRNIRPVSLSQAVHLKPASEIISEHGGSSGRCCSGVGGSENMQRMTCIACWYFFSRSKSFGPGFWTAYKRSIIAEKITFINNDILSKQVCVF